MLFAADLIDEIQILYVPKILGKGIPLFPCEIRKSQWNLIKNKSYGNGVLHVNYQRKLQ